MQDNLYRLGFYDLETDASRGQLELDSGAPVEDIALNAHGDQLALVQRRLIEPADEPGEIPVQQVIVRVLSLDYTDGGLQYRELGRPREMGSASVYRVSFRDETSLEYVTYGTNNLLHWDFTTDVLKSMSF
jgi:hypothetical protein